MKKSILMFILILSCATSNAQWTPAGDRLKTRWAKDVSPENPLPEYPRPIMERGEWRNLNGLWDYAIRKAGESEPSQYDGKILVPFAVESSLSGVGRTVGKENNLWYHRTFKIPSEWKGKNIILHFGAVDWLSEIYINGIKTAVHRGGFTGFEVNITPFLKPGEQELTVKVWDPSNEGYQPAGKQNVKPGGIMYTTVTGIWQTVWIEPVPELHIKSVLPEADIDGKKLTVETAIAGLRLSGGEYIEATLKDGAKTVASAKSAAGETIELIVEDPKLWTPDTPFLYDLEISLFSGRRQVDKVKSYAAMRKVSMKRDGAGTSDGVVRMQLNNKDIFHFGPLDQGYWPDGLYTAPTDEALAFDIVKTKDLGFNMIRKHQKVEPARWYYHCDRLGMLVWQDMPSGDGQAKVDQRHYSDVEITRTPESEANFRNEWKAIIELLKPQPCIVMWVVFNEAWGQFKTVELSDWTKSLDRTRLVNPASGGNSQLTGDVLDVHIYPKPKLCLYDPERTTVLGEYGGLGMPVEGHLWDVKNSWGYVQFDNKKAITDKYVEYGEALLSLVKPYYSGAVYTQTTDVEIEVNGLLTYDRELVKYEEERIRKINTEISRSLDSK
jgi:beta-galactosidase/beta-glucuronidase